MMLKRILYNQKFLNLKNYKNITINYYITYKIYNNKYIYGIEIIKYKNTNNFSKIVENDSITNISYNYKSIKNIIKTLSNNYVTPITLQYIIDDIIENISLK